MQRPTKVPPGKAGVYTLSDTQFSELYPLLTQWMCDGFWDDGKGRKLSTLSINFSSGTVNLGLSDHEFERSAYTTAATLEAALSLLEDSLAAGTVSWRPWKTGKGRG